jgi:hypothetical protein
LKLPQRHKLDRTALPACEIPPQPMACGGSKWGGKPGKSDYVAVWRITTRPSRTCGRAPRGGTESAINPINQDGMARLSQSPNCGARTRAGTPCQRRPIRGRNRCRLHGGLSPGAPRGSRNGNFRNGHWTKEAIEERRWLSSLVRSFAPTSALDHEQK